MDSERIPWPGGARAAVVLTFDVDAESGVLWEFPDTARRLGIMSHQAYGARAGLPRLLRVLARHGARATFFVPGFTADAHPDAVRGIVDAGHEIGHHGYVHEIVTELTPAAEEAVLERGAEALERLTGVRPRGWRAPMWELNYGTPALLAAHGFAYDSSLMDADVPYRVATGSQKGAPTIVEIPPHWSLDDGEQYAWLPGIWDTAAIEGPDKLLRMWEMDFEAAVAEGGCLVLTMHPCLSGRPARAAAFERLLERIVGTPGVWVASAGEVADHVDALAPAPVFHEPPPIDPADLARRVAPACIRRPEGGAMNDAAFTPTPREAGYHMPAEWWPHERCLISWPTVGRAYWGEYYLLAQATHAAVARAVARFEPVLVIANPGEGGNATSYCGSDNIEVVELPIDDSWIRDNGPYFLLGPDGRRAVADFAFNSWGEKYLPYDKDADVTRLLCEHFGWERFAAPMILEGGAFTVDGEGTLVTTASCLLHPTRNPRLTKQQQEEILHDYLGVEKVVWLAAGRTEATDTDGHVDGVCHFVAPGRVILHMVHEPDHVDYANFRENRRVLDETKDAKGRSFEVLEMDRRTMIDIGGKHLTVTYVNSYQANGGLIVPTAGSSYDEHALERLREIFPSREVVGVPTPVLAYGGGGIHCITQQVPMPAGGPR